MSPKIPLYNFQATEPDKNLSPNQFYFVCDQSGHYLKLKQKNEFDEVCSWDNILFKSILKSNDYIHFLIARTWHKVLFSRLKTSAPIELGVFDFHVLQHDFCAHISKIKIGGKQIPETYELL